MKAIIIDSSKSIQQSLEAFLQIELNIDVMASFNNGADLLNCYNAREAGFILMDTCMPDLNVIETSKRYLLENPGQKIIAVTMYNDRSHLVQLLEAGVKGCVNKNRIYQDLEKAINSVVGNRLFFPKELVSE